VKRLSDTGTTPTAATVKNFLLDSFFFIHFFLVKAGSLR
jgi:hypothetical protein